MLARGGWEREKKQPVHVRALVDETIEQLYNKRRDKAMSLQIRVPETLYIDVYPGALERVVSNVVDNAWKYTPDGGIITIDADETSMRISDTGAGIASVDLEDIWQPFRQADVSRGEDA